MIHTKFNLPVVRTWILQKENRRTLIKSFFFLKKVKKIKFHGETYFIFSDVPKSTKDKVLKFRNAKNMNWDLYN
jgi:hypothetical protein